MKTASEYVPQNPKLLEKVNVKVLRAFYIDRQLREIGSVVEVERYMGQMLRDANKAEILDS